MKRPVVASCSGLSVRDIEDPLPDATFGSIGRYVEVALPELDEPHLPQRLTLSFDDEQAAHVDTWTLMLFRIDRDLGEFNPIESSSVDVDKREVTAWVDQPGIYGLIGLPKHLGVLETLRLLDRFAPQLLEERERGEDTLHRKICGLILCADPTVWDSAPTGPGDLCQKCLGLELSWARLPEKYLLEHRPEIPPLREVVDDEVPTGTASLLAWGGNGYGKLGDGSTTTRSTPVWVVPRLTTKKVVGPVSGDWTLALGTDGTVWAWGFNGSGQLGDGTLVTHRSTPTRVGLLDKVVDLAAGPTHGVAVRSDGSVWRWGLESAFAHHPDRLPVRVAGLSDIVAVAAGINFTLALRSDGRVFAWGQNGNGQLGDGTQATRSNPVQVAGLTAVRSIAAGLSSSFAIKSNGAVVAWGAEPYLGSGGIVNRLTPVPVQGPSNVEQVSIGNHHRLARTTAGDVWFWGFSSYGQSVKGQQDLPVGGQWTCPVVATGSAHWRPTGLPGQSPSGLTPFPRVAWVSRIESPVVITTWAWCISRSTVALAIVLGISSSNPAG